MRRAFANPTVWMGNHYITTIRNRNNRKVGEGELHPRKVGLHGVSSSTILRMVPLPQRGRQRSPLPRATRAFKERPYGLSLTPVGAPPSKLGTCAPAVLSFPVPLRSSFFILHPSFFIIHLPVNPGRRVLSLLNGRPLPDADEPPRHRPPMGKKHISERKLPNPLCIFV